MQFSLFVYDSGATYSFIKTRVMKLILFVIASFFSVAVIAQKNISIDHSINDDGKKLSIKIKGSADGKPIDYYRVFDVTGMSKAQKDALKDSVYDSLGLPSPVAPMAPLTPLTPAAPLVVMEANSAVPVISSKSQYTELYTIGGDHPYTKEIKYNPKTGILYMKYRFIKNGEEVTREKSLDAKDKSAEERSQLIKNYEKEIGILKTEAI